jgi:hypothetical protein
MQSGFLFRVGVLDKADGGAGFEIGDVGNLNVVADALPVVLKVEAGVLYRIRLVDDGLPNVLNLLLGMNLGG